VATIMTMERTKLRSIVLHWTRPARLAFRGLVSKGIYTARFFRRLPGAGVRGVITIARRFIVTPLRWATHRAKMAVHAFLVWRKGQPDQVP